jgi:ubiquitin-conjugating enzyme E2 variant
MRAIEIFSIALFLILLAVSLSGLEMEFKYVPVAALCGWSLADLFSGLVHWSLDTFGSVRTPVVGPAFIRPFREHHADPQAMARHDFVEVNGASCIGCLPLLVLSLYLEGLLHSVAVFTCVGVLFTNQCHKWAHMDAPPALVRLLQKLRLVLRAEEHRLHHTPPYDSHFCTASGWLNRPLDGTLRAFLK